MKHNKGKPELEQQSLDSKRPASLNCANNAMYSIWHNSSMPHAGNCYHVKETITVIVVMVS